MKEVAELDQELTIEERNLLSVAYKNIIVGCLRFLSLYDPPYITSQPSTSILHGSSFLCLGAAAHACGPPPLFGHFKDEAVNRRQAAPSRQCSRLCCMAHKLGRAEGHLGQPSVIAWQTGRAAGGQTRLSRH